jgi:hypothetical protein
MVYFAQIGGDQTTSTLEDGSRNFRGCLHDKLGRKFLS